MKVQTNTTFTQWVKPWSYRIFAVVTLLLYGAFLLAGLAEGEPGYLLLIIPVGILMLFAAVFVALPAFTRVSVCTDGVTLSLWRFTLREIAAEDIKTIVKYEITFGRPPVTQLIISKEAAKDMEAAGERKLRKKSLIRHDLPFREGRSDWGDLCLGGGFQRKDTIWIEFSRERKQLLQRTFLHAEYREAKRYTDPPTPAQLHKPR